MDMLSADIVAAMKDYISDLEALLQPLDIDEVEEVFSLKAATVREEFLAMKASDDKVNDPERTQNQINRFLNELQKKALQPDGAPNTVRDVDFLCLQECDEKTYKIIEPIVDARGLAIVSNIIEKGDCAIIYDPSKFTAVEGPVGTSIKDFAVVRKFTKDTDSASPFYVICAHLKSGKKNKETRTEQVKRLKTVMSAFNHPIILSVDANCQFAELNRAFRGSLKDPSRDVVLPWKNEEVLLPRLDDTGDRNKVYSDHFAVKRWTTEELQNMYEPGTDYNWCRYSTYKQRGCTTEQPDKIYELIEKETIDFIFFFAGEICVETIDGLDLEIIGKNVLKAKGGDGFLKQHREGTFSWTPPAEMDTSNKKARPTQDIPKLVKRFMLVVEKTSVNRIDGQLLRFVQVYYWLKDLDAILKGGDQNGDQKIANLSDLAESTDIRVWQAAFAKVESKIRGRPVEKAATFVHAVRWLKDIDFTANVIKLKA